MTHYLIYKITNNVNGKIYIGKHVTENLDDGYMGSGVLITRAINKYGVENFTKEILYDVDDEELMDFVEELIVDEAFVAREDTYNIALGGKGGGGWCHSEEAKRKISEKAKGRPSAKGMLGKRQSEEAKRKMSEAHKGKHLSEDHKRKLSESKNGNTCHFGKHHSEDTRQKISEAQIGRKNHFYGKHHSEDVRRKISETLKKRNAERKVG